jgi:hypothetical protein
MMFCFVLFFRCCLDKTLYVNPPANEESTYTGDTSESLPSSDDEGSSFTGLDSRIKGSYDLPISLDELSLEQRFTPTKGKPLEELSKELTAAQRKAKLLEDPKRMLDKQAHIDIAHSCVVLLACVWVWGWVCGWLFLSSLLLFSNCNCCTKLGRRSKLPSCYSVHHRGPWLPYGRPAFRLYLHRWYRGQQYDPLGAFREWPTIHSHSCFSLGGLSAKPRGSWVRDSCCVHSCSC